MTDQNKNIKSNDELSSNNKKRKYKKPKITSEPLVAFGAVCNGAATGGRKESTGAPNFCNSNKLLS